MRLVFKLYAGLADYLPAEAEKNATSLDLPDETTAYDIIDKFNVPRERAHLVLLNGVYLNPDERNSANLNDGDTLAIWPPIAGGGIASGTAIEDEGLGKTMTTVIEREMTITHRDFFRLLPRAIAGKPYQQTGNRITVEYEAGTVEISLSEQTSRKLAAFVFPVTHIRLELKDFSEADEKKFMTRFNLAYQKGGG